MTPHIDKPDWIVAQEETVIKPGTKPASKYFEQDLIRVERDDKFFVARGKYEQAEGGHWKVLLDDPNLASIGYKYIYDSTTNGHWLTSWEQDSEEQEIVAAPAVISTASKDSPVGDGLRPEMPFATRITPNITYGEFALYQEERRFNFKHQCHTAYLIAMYLEEVRAEFGGNPVVITSGYRPPAVNRRVGGATYSEHLYSAPSNGAVDFYIKGLPVLEVQDYCDRTWACSIGYGAKRGFVHLGVRPAKPRVRWVY